MPTPAEAAAILRAHFGMVSDPVDPDVMVGDPTGAIALGGQRGAAASDLAARVYREAPGASRQVESFVPGEPGRRQVTRPFADQYISDEATLAHLQDAMAADPFTGTAEQARVGGIQKALDTAATTQRPEIGDAAETVAKRNAFAEYMKSHGMKLGEKMGEYEAGASPEAYAAGMTPIRVKGSAESQAVLDADSRRAMALADVKKPPIKYTAAEQQVIDKANEIQHDGPELMALMEQDLPGIGKDATQYGSWFDKVNASVGGWIYRKGKQARPMGIALSN
jgi:hypothetical protein